MSRIAIIDYRMGNLHSVSKAIEFVGGDAVVTSDPKAIEAADKIVLPGAGAFAEGMERLRELGMIEVLNREVREKHKPFLGICLGMQLAAVVGEEHGRHAGLGWIDARVVRFSGIPESFKIPHMGWDDVRFVAESPLFAGLDSPATFYFVHSYHVVPADDSIVTATCDYGKDVVVAVSTENLHLVQFHPEKSQKKGLKVLENFIAL